MKTHETNETAQHTAGPWRVSKTGDVYKKQGRDGLIAAVRFLGGDNSEGTANAKLIAAAPELLEALRLTEAALESYQTAKVGVHHSALEAARAAIHKATA